MTFMPYLHKHYLVKECGAEPFIIKILEDGFDSQCSDVVVALIIDSGEERLIFKHNILRRISEKEVLLRSIK